MCVGGGGIRVVVIRETAVWEMLLGVALGLKSRVGNDLLRVGLKGWVGAEGVSG